MTDATPQPGPRGTQIRRDHGHAKLVTINTRYWTPEDEDTFLDALATTANVSAAAREAGFSATAIYRRRRSDAAFAAKWQAALEQGVARIQMALVRAASDSIEGIEFDADRPIPKMTVDQVINLMKLHAVAVGLPGNRYGRTPRRRTLEDLKDILLRKAEAARIAHPDE